MPYSIKNKFYSKSTSFPNHLNSILNIFQTYGPELDSETEVPPGTLKSDHILDLIRHELISLGYKVENKKDKVSTHILDLYDPEGNVARSFYCDAYNKDLGTLIEIEAGMAIDNLHILRDLYEGSMNTDCDYLVIALKKLYKTISNPKGSPDYLKALPYFETLYRSNIWTPPLEGILLIGY